LLLLVSGAGFDSKKDNSTKMLNIMFQKFSPITGRIWDPETNHPGSRYRR
jgi:hypothetical protein